MGIKFHRYLDADSIDTIKVTIVCMIWDVQEVSEDFRTTDTAVQVQDKLLKLVKQESPLLLKYLKELPELEKKAKAHPIQIALTDRADKEGFHSEISCELGKLLILHGELSTTQCFKNERLWIEYLIEKQLSWPMGYRKQLLEFLKKKGRF